MAEPSALSTLPLPELMKRARAVRDTAFGTRVTYSPRSSSR